MTTERQSTPVNPINTFPPLKPVLSRHTPHLAEFAVTSSTKPIMEAQQLLTPKEYLREHISNLLSPEEKLFLLKGTGFDVITQIVTYIDEYNIETANGLTQEQINAIFISKTTQDLKGFYWEFLAREPVLTIDLKTTEVDKKRKVVSPKYGNKPLEEVVSADEREGAIKAAIVNLVSQIPHAPKGSMFVITSPDGWTGLVDENNQELKFPESQTHFYKVGSNGRLDAITIRTSMTLEEHEKLVSSPLAKDVSIRERIKKVAGTVVFLNGQDSNHEFENVVETMQQIRGSQIAWEDESSGRTLTFEDIKKAIRNREKLSELEPKIQSTIDTFATFVEENMEAVSEESLKDLAIQIGKIVMQMSKVMENARQENPNPISAEMANDLPHSAVMTQQEYQRQHMELKTLSGCVAAPPNSTTIIQTPFGPRLLTKEKKWKYEPGKCEVCGKHKQKVGPCGICIDCEKKYD